MFFTPSVYSLDLVNLYKESKTESYHAATLQDLSMAEELFHQLFLGNFDNIATQWSKLGFEVKEVKDHRGYFVILIEDREHQTGKGFYVFNKNPQGNTIIQAPHGDSDLNTGRIAINLINTGAFLSGAWNTVHRKEADLAHLDNTYFMAYTKAFTKAHPNGHIVQIHGFENAKREEEIAKTADIIISSGTENPSGWATHVNTCMKKSFGETVLLYPTEVKELGGLTNIIATTSQSIAFNGFLQIEMSKDFRWKLLQDKAALNQYKSCLLQN